EGDSAAALADYTNVIRLDTEHGKAYNNRGIQRNSQGDSAGAMEDFNTAIRLAPYSPEAYANRGMLHLAKNDLQSAFYDFTKVLEVTLAAWPHRAEIEQLHISIRKRLETVD
ncbi:MAG: tetratricopeptide repeat protein, partial [Desulfobacterales bacterium]|nr:tetratricopeptide repeat protein [Candidatus Desulfatibia vada]